MTKIEYDSVHLKVNIIMMIALVKTFNIVLTGYAYVDLSSIIRLGYETDKLNIRKAKSYLF